MKDNWRAQIRGFSPVVWIIMAGSFFCRGTYFMVWPFLSILLYRKFGLGAAEIGLILTATAVGASLLGFYVSALSDRYGRKRMLLAGGWLNAGAFVMLMLAESLQDFVIAMTLCSIGRAIWEGPASALIGDLVRERHARELALQLRYFIINIAAAIGPAIGLWAGLTAQQLTFGLTAASYIALNIVLMVVFRELRVRRARQESSGMRTTLSVLRRDHLFLAIILANILTLFVYAHMDSSLVQYLTREGVEELVGLVSSLILINGLTIITLQFPLLRLTAGWPLNYRIYCGLALLALSQLWYALNPPQFIAGWMGATFLLSVAETLLFPTMSVQVDRLAPDHMRGAYFGAASFYAFGWALAPIVGGLVLDAWGGPVLFGTTAVLTLAAAGIYSVSGKLSRPHLISEAEDLGLAGGAALAEHAA
ncbi:MDR family MFS transporter [Biformimicrobium ophioploci]|uniref:MFS transporter n=1 Tax=Biformimicrobium ophioploci TaxID=3036711 RepID=A0ABQ6LXV5_9GAMM|nr:MFS transporter [Microbulbifer sp. NKW57]GMG86910.1 MFS transporter [Microbulbifer sp. NKW57]